MKRSSIKSRHSTGGLVAGGYDQRSRRRGRGGPVEEQTLSRGSVGETGLRRGRWGNGVAGWVIEGEDVGEMWCGCGKRRDEGGRWGEGCWGDVIAGEARVGRER